MARKTVFVLIVAITLLLGAGVWFLSQQDKPKDLSDASSIGQQTKGEPQNSTEHTEQIENESTQNANANKVDNPKRDEQTSDSLKEPSGNFVSSHIVQIDSLIASSCVTSAGATCTIIFTNGTTTKSLDKRTTDREGAAYWEWTPEQVGLTAGEWTVKAVVSNGDITKSAEDAIKLKVET